MIKRKSLILKIATFTLALAVTASFTTVPSLLFIGEPELPTKMK